MDSTQTGLQEWLLKDDNESVLEEEDAPQTLSREVAAEIASDSEETVAKMATIWMQMGLNTSEVMARVKEVRDLHSTANRNALQTESSCLQRLIEHNDTKLKQINCILNDLTLPTFTAPTDVSLKQTGRILVYKFNELEALKKERLNQLTELKSKRDKLLKNMNAKAKEFRTATNIPSDEELMHLQSYVSDLTKERSKRFNKYKSLKKIIEELFASLEREVKSDFEKHLLFEESDDFILSDDHMKRLQTLHSELESSYSQNNDKRKQLEKRLDSLWTKMEVQESYRDSFYRHKNGCKPSVLALLEEEVLKYEELKRQNIELFIQKVRTELDEWYDKCYSSEDQRDKFQSFIESTEFSEELLDLHEKELQRLQSYYEECEDMFDKLEEWRSYWERYKEFENKANDPNRFNNRGGALLAEEREKNAIKKKLPKVENILKKMSDERQLEKGEHFEVLGQPVKQFMENLKMEFQDMKENEKKEKQRMKQLEKNGFAKGGTKSTPVCSVMRKTPVKRAFTPLSSGTNGDSNSKVRRIGGPLTPSREMNSHQSVTHKPIPRARGRNLQTQMNQLADNHIEGSCLSINEDQFQAPLTDRDNANSTFISHGNRGLTPSRNVTKRREPKEPAINRRLSRSCNDLSEAMTKKMQITNGRQLGATRSTPASPQPKSSYGMTPSRLPRIGIPQRKKPFLI